jgi:hypothetical protein
MPGKKWTEERKDAHKARLEAKRAAKKSAEKSLEFIGHFERQVLLFCGKHALNNLFRNCGYYKLNKLCFGTEPGCINLDKICDEILQEAVSIYNVKDKDNAKVVKQYLEDNACDPKRGNYKDEVIQAAIRQADCSYARFFPTLTVDGKAQKCGKMKECLQLYVNSLSPKDRNNVIGCIFNQNSKHWTSAVPSNVEGKKNVNDYWYFDSLKKAPLKMSEIKFGGKWESGWVVFKNDDFLTADSYDSDTD